jgi:hypothetical protein
VNTIAEQRSVERELVGLIDAMGEGEWVRRAKVDELVVYAGIVLGALRERTRHGVREIGVTVLGNQWRIMSVF